MGKYTKLLIGAILIIVVAGTISGFKRRKIDLIMPDELITYEDAQALAEGYKLNDGEVKKFGNRLETEYLSDPIGSGDNIKVELVYYSDEYPKSAVENFYDSDRDRLLVYEDLTDIGQKAFIAFPSAFIYDSGFYVKITAGSGSNDAQGEVLKSLSKTAAERLDKYLTKNKLK